MREFLLHIYVLPLTISAILSLKSFRYGWPVQYKTFSVILILTLGFETLGILWQYWLHNLPIWQFSRNNVWLYNVSYIPISLLYFIFYFQILKKNRIKRLIVVASFAFVLFAMFNLQFFQKIYFLNSYTIIFVSLILILLSVFYFNQLKNEEPFTKLNKQPLFWLVTATFLFNSTRIPFILGFEYLITKSSALVFAAYNLYLTLICLFYIIYIIGYLCKPHQQK